VPTVENDADACIKVVAAGVGVPPNVTDGRIYLVAG
jgi:hypothetical protein